MKKVFQKKFDSNFIFLMSFLSKNKEESPIKDFKTILNNALPN